MRPTRFAMDVGRVRRPRAKIDAYLDFVRQRPCLITGHPGVQAAHIRYADMRYGKRGTGMGEKPDDCWVVPLSPDAHAEQHSMNERRWWESKGIDPCLVASLLFGHFVLCADDLADVVCMSARQGLIGFPPN